MVALDLSTPAARSSVVVGPPAATAARVFDADGGLLLELSLDAGTAALAFPAGAPSVQVLRADGSTAGASPVLSGGSATWGEDGQSPSTSFGIPLPPPR